jgi:threonine aldolase
MIDLRSDTVTKPCAGMRKAMASARVGDDVYREDPTVDHLERYSADLMGKEAGLFAPSGTQTNLVALLTHCTRGDEYIVGQDAHTFKYEGGGAAVLGGIQPNPLRIGIDGTLSPEDVISTIKPDDVHFAKTKLICLENTHAGTPLPLNYSRTIKNICRKYDLAMHLDGARLFNAAIFDKLEPIDLVKNFETVSFCLSKGLGAPIGSVLVGNKDFIETGRRWRKVLGGGMRQAGILASAGLYALQNNIGRLTFDHEKAMELFTALSSRFGADNIRCATNMIHLDIDKDIYSSLVSHLEGDGIRVGRPRWVLHKDISKAAIGKIKRLIRSFK